MFFDNSYFHKDVRNLIVEKYLNGLDRFMLFAALGIQCCPVDSDIVICAVKHGHLNLLTWLEERYPHIRTFSDTIITEAAYNGHLDILEHYKEKLSRGCVIYPACGGGRINVLEWFDNINDTTLWKYQGHAMNLAAFEGHVKVMRWLRERKCPTVSALYYAIDGGHLDTLKYLYETGCSFIGGSLDAAILGRFEILRWMASVGILGDKEKCLELAKDIYPEIAAWLESF